MSATPDVVLHDERDGVTAVRGLPVIVLATSLALTFVAVILLSVLVPEPLVVRPSVALEQPDAGGVVCAAGASGERIETENAFVVTAVTDGDDDTIQARASLLVLGSASQRLVVEPLEPAGSIVVTAPLGIDGWLWSGWADRATVTWREWNSSGGPGLPRGRSAAACIATSAATFVVPGLRTDGGNEAYLTLANPFTADATFAVTFLTPLGRTEPIALRNVSVSAGTRVQVRVNDHLPREADVAAIVSVGAGRLAVEGYQLALAGVGGIDGLTIVQASTAPSTSWTVPWLVSDDQRSTWLWVVNPEPRSVTLDVVVHTASGPTLPGDFESITVPALGVLRVPASDLAPRAGEPFGVTLTSDTTGVHVSAGLQVTGETVEMTGISTVLASPAGDERWLLAGRGAPERETTLHVVNLGEEEAGVSLALRVREGESTSSSPRSLADLVVPPGGVVRVRLPLPQDGVWSLEVSGPPDIVVGRTAFGQASLEPVVTSAVPSSAWRRPVLPLAGRPLDGWGRALGTAADLRPAGSRLGALPPLEPEPEPEG
jgi:hypothetical protein